jgi:glycosyltransferase involved in cell wall biosynthesis
MLLDREFPPDIRVQNEAQSLIKEGHVIHVLSYNFGHKKSYELFKGIHVHRFHIHEQIAKKSLGLIFMFPIFKKIWKFRVFEFLNQHKIDAIHIHDLPLCILTKQLKNKGYKLVADMHENYPYMVMEQSYMNTLIGKKIFSRQKWFKKEQEWLDTADQIICVAPEMKRRLQAIVQPSKSICVVPNTYSLNSFGAEQVEIPELIKRFTNRYVISYIGGFDQARGIHLLIEAVHQLSDQIPGLLLVLVGDGSIKEHLIEMTRKLEIEDKILFEGWQPSKHVEAYIESSSVCVIPHIRSEQTDNSSPNKLFQYMYKKKPVVSSNCTSLEKIVLQEKCGLIFQDKDSADLAKKLLYLFNNPEECMQMGNHGQKAVLEKYNWDVTVEPLLEIYRNPEIV